MKNVLSALLLTGLLALGGTAAQAQAQPATPNNTDLKARHLPAVTVRTLSGTPVSAASLPGVGKGKPVIISFWATWCKPCIAELTNISEIYPDWQRETGVQVVAVSIDDARNAARVGPLAQGRNWPYTVYLDQNQDLKRALNVNNVPHTFLLNGAGEIVWQHNAYNEGDELELYKLVQKLSRGEAVSQ